GGYGGLFRDDVADCVLAYAGRNEVDDSGNLLDRRLIEFKIFYVFKEINWCLDLFSACLDTSDYCQLTPLKSNFKDLSLKKHHVYYAVAWVHPRRKLSTRLDTDGHVNPTWNDKFVFRFGNLIPPAARSQYNGTASSNPPGMRFVALQVRRPSGCPQGILNFGVTILNGSMRSMPLYTQLSTSAVGYRDLMGEENHSPNHHLHQYNKNNLPLRRTRSERASNVTDSDFTKLGLALNGSDIGEPPLATVTTGSFWSESDLEPRLYAVGAAAEELFPVTRNVLENWGEDDASVKDLKTKLEKWQTELPPIYDRGGGNASISKARHGRRQTDGGLVGGPGLLSCFGDSYGFECSISCGLKPKYPMDVVREKVTLTMKRMRRSFCPN
ncbi:hypothetical protein GIB67_006462, partial [Kingdonia uniflora]